MAHRERHSREWKFSPVNRPKSTPASARRLPLAAKISVLAGLLALGGAISLMVVWNTQVTLPPVLPQPDIPLSELKESESSTSVSQGADASIPLPTQAPTQTKARSQEVRYRILLAVLDPDDNYSSDALIVANVNCTRRTIDMVSIPRDTYVETSSRSDRRINGAYGSARDVRRLLNEVKSLLSFVPDYYIIGSLGFVEELVDLVGGIDFDIPVKMNSDDLARGLSIHFEKGMTHLNGRDAVKVLRYRKSYGDFGRMRTQQAFVRTYLRKMLSIQNISQLPRLPEIVDRHVDSNLSWGQMLALAMEMKDIDTETGLNSQTLPVVDYTLDGHIRRIMDRPKASAMLAHIFSNQR